MKCHPVNFKVKKNRDHSQFVPQYKPLNDARESWSRIFFITESTYFHSPMKPVQRQWKLATLIAEQQVKAFENLLRLEVMNDLPVIGSLCLRGVLGSAQNKHCKSSERNVRREVVSSSKKMILESFCLNIKICWKIYRCAAQSLIWNWHRVMVSKQRNIS